MDRIVIDSDFSSGLLNINKDSCVVISKDVQANKFEFNIINCKVAIIDMSNVGNKIFNFNESEGKIVEITSCNGEKKLKINNNNSNIEYNIIDLLDNNVSYLVNEEIISNGASTSINIASISYKNKNKEYKINTSNLCENTINEISCFGIVKDNSILNYDINSFVKNGARKSVVKQNSNILLFDEKSIGKNNPILIIEENDVKASHGSSIGKIDDDTMFYLCSRGLNKNDATNLICLGKIEYLINKIDDEEIKESLVNKFKERMS